MKFEEVLNSISVWSIVLPLFVGLVRVRFLSRDSLIIVMIVFLGTIPQLLRYVTSDKEISNLIYNVYTPIEFCLFFFLFRNKFDKRAVKLLFYISGLLYFLFSIFLAWRFNIRSTFVSEW